MEISIMEPPENNSKKYFIIAGIILFVGIISYFLMDNNPSCNSTWQCTSWSACANNQQTRTCTDLKGCTTPTNLPSLTQSCSSTCTPNCNGKICGNNGCGGSCGSCPTGKLCDSNGICNYISNIEEIKNAYLNYFGNNPKVSQLTLNNNFNGYSDEFWSYIVELEKTGIMNIQKPVCIHEITNMCFLSNDDAYKYLTARIAHSIWLDKNNKVSWKLENYNNEQLRTILSPECMSGLCDHYSLFLWVNEAGINSPGFFNVIAYSPSITYSHSKSLIKSTKEETIYSILDYLGMYRHIISNMDPPGKLEYLEDSLNTKISQFGCGSISMIVTEFANNLNIPAYTYFNKYELSENYDTVGHAGVIFPEIGCIAHGDWVYSYVPVKNENKVIPWDYLMENIKPYADVDGENPADVNSLFLSGDFYSI